VHRSSGRLLGFAPIVLPFPDKRERPAWLASVTRADEVEDALTAAIAANKPYLIEVPVDREIRPIGTGSWDLPPLPQPEPNFLKALAAAGLSL
jgi:hypothetical protein